MADPYHDDYAQARWSASSPQQRGAVGPPQRPGQGGGGSNRQRDLAAVMLWVTGGLQGLIFMCCSFFMFMGIQQISNEELANRVLEDVPSEQVSDAQARMLRKALPVVTAVMASTSAIIGLLGAALVALGFAVRRASHRAGLAALIILSAEALLLSLLTLLMVGGSLVTGDLLGGGVNLVVGGGLIFLIGVTFIRVRGANRDQPHQPPGSNRPPGPADAEAEPWNAHLR